MKIKNNVDVNRRRALIGGAAGVGLAAWHKPMIESVLLPAHAQTSMVTPTVFFLANINAGPLITQNNSLLDFFIPQAYAGKGEGPEPTVTLTIRAEDTSGDLTEFDVGLFTQVTGLEGFEVVESVHRGTVTVAAGGTLMPTEVPCDEIEVEDIDVEVVTVDGELFSLNLLGFDLVLDAPAEDLPLPTAVCTPLSFGDYQIFGESQNNTTLLDVLVPQALAGVPTNGVAVIVTSDSAIAINSGDNINFTVTYQNGINRWSGPLVAEADSPSPLTLVGPPCGDPPATINARIAEVYSNELDLRVDSPTNPMAQLYLEQVDMPTLPPLDPCVLVGD